MTAPQCIWACGHDQDDLLVFKQQQNGEERISDFECGLVVSASQADLSISEPAHLLGFFPQNLL